MDIDKDKFYVFMETVGNTVSSTIPIALCEAKKESKLHGNVVLAGFGVGLSWGSIYFETNKPVVSDLVLVEDSYAAVYA